MRHNNYVRLEKLTTALSNLIRESQYYSKLKLSIIVNYKQNWSILVPVPKQTGQF